MAELHFQNQAIPSLPQAGKVKIFVDSADNHIKQVDSNGLTLDLTAGASSVSYDKDRAPTVNDDANNVATPSYVNTLWTDNSVSPRKSYVCKDNTDGAAVWAEIALVQNAAGVALDNTNLVVAPVAELQAFAEGVDHSLLKSMGTGVSTSYVSSVSVGGTTFAQSAVDATIKSDQGFFDLHYAGATEVTVADLCVSSTYVYIDNAGTLQQQTSIPTRQDWSRKAFTMRISVDTSTNLIIAFEYLNNPTGNFSNSMRDIYSYLLAQGVPFKRDQVVTGRSADLGFDISAGSLLEFGGTGDINNPNIRSFDLVANASYSLLSKTDIVSAETNLVKFWDDNGVITALGLPSTRLDLGTAVNFGVLAGGAISGTGSTTGDIGSRTGAIAPAITSTGTIYPTGDAVVVAALTDFSTAYNVGKNTAYDTLLSAAAFELGGSTLTAGIYKIGAAATLATPMTFDAQGNSDATFIIQIVGTLGTTASVGNVALLNGAQSSNIFWVVEGSVTAGAGTHMEGTLLCGSAITFGATTTINGRAFAGSAAGTVALSATTITLPTELMVPSVVGHRLYRFSSGSFAMQYGQGNYANLSLAKSGVKLEEYELNPRLKNATFFGWWLIESTASNTQQATLTNFIEYTIGTQGGSSSVLSGCLLKGNSLSDLLNTAAARTNIGLGNVDNLSNANQVSTGALNSGSITSGFGPIDVGASAITTTGAVTGEVMSISETTTPTATANHGKIYTKTDNKLYFQDGSGVEHEISFV